MPLQLHSLLAKDWRGSQTPQVSAEQLLASIEPVDAQLADAEFDLPVVRIGAAELDIDVLVGPNGAHSRLRLCYRRRLSLRRNRRRPCRSRLSPCICLGQFRTARNCSIRSRNSASRRCSTT